MILQPAFLLWSLVAVAVVLASIFTIYATHSLLIRWRDFRDLPRLRATRSLVLRACADAPAKSEALEPLRSLPRRSQLSVLEEIAPHVRGGQRKCLTDLARAVGLEEYVERLCGSRRWWRRLYGCRLATLLDLAGRSAPPLLADRNLRVRAEAATWVGGHSQPELIPVLLDFLEDRAALVRFAAQDALLRAGRPVVPFLAGYLRERTGPGIDLALRVAAGLPQHEFEAPALRLARHPTAPTRAAAALLLAGLGGARATDRLLRLLADPSVQVRSAAATGLGKLGHWPAATELAAAMTDASWLVRRDAALALGRLGSPGRLLLRRTLASPDTFAADMARQVLGLPGPDRLPRVATP